MSHNAQEKEEMDRMIDQYSTGLRPFSISVQSSNHASKPKAVAITGTTGSLGSFLLAKLLEVHPGTVYAINRKATQSSRARQLQSFRSRQLPTDQLDRVIYLEARYGEPNLGLSFGDYRQLVHDVKLFVLCAWSINWRVPLEHFVPHLKTIRQVIEIANTSAPGKQNPAKIVFISSIGAMMGMPTVPEQINEYYNQNDGYGRSKFVAEMILDRASRITGLETEIYRVGQISGDIVTGCWSPDETPALLLKSCVGLKAVPDSEFKIGWIPVDIVARIITELLFADGARLSGDKTSTVYHVVNSCPLTSFKDMIPVITKMLGVQIVPTQTWLSLMEAFSGPMRDCPARLLPDFFKELVELKTTHVSAFQVTKTAARSETMRSLKSITPDILKLYITYWQRIGYLPSRSAAIEKL